jgi:S-DNA-T family DNA segregation ATPase FtsK/SpoIIIE
MSALSARVAVVAGRNAIGIELPNPTREKVYLRELLASNDYADNPAKLPLCLGKTIGGEPVIVDLARMPHLLIAGTTGSGKSVAINTMILSLLYRLRPEQCRLIMVDPKMLELSVYDGIPHLLTPVVTDPKKAVVALKWAVREMEERYKKMSKLGVRNIDGYNARLAEAKAKGEKLSRTVHTGYDKESGEAIYEREELDLESLPLIVVIVDEMADLMMVAGKDIEGAVQRLAQMASVGRRHHRHDQGEFSDPDLLPGHFQDRQPDHSRRAGRRAAPRSGRHALHGGRRADKPGARAFLLRRGSRKGRPAPQGAGQSAISRGRHRGRRRG